MPAANHALYLVRREDLDTWQLAGPSGPLTRRQGLPACMAEATRLLRGSCPGAVPVWCVQDDDTPGRWKGHVTPAGDWSPATPEEATR